MTDPAQQLLAAVTERARGTGYVVTKTPRGFRVERDLSDATWWGPLFKAGVHRLTAHEVRVDAATRQLTITDEMRNVEWQTGADPRPMWRGHAEMSRGRMIQLGFRKSYGVRGDGTLGPIEDYRYDTREGRDLIRASAAELGWSERMPWEQKVGLLFGVVGAVGAVVTVVTLLVFLALGKF
jgi:hypothetical protein